MSVCRFLCILIIYAQLFLAYISCQDWLSRATNWAKFSATAGLGVIHRGHLQQGRSLMAPYLPQGGAGGGGSPYSEGGALYALGLIHANHGEGIKQFLRESLRSTSVEVHLLF
jgi:26S proteasome regulatory subunit N2